MISLRDAALHVREQPAPVINYLYSVVRACSNFTHCMGSDFWKVSGLTLGNDEKIIPTPKNIKMFFTFIIGITLTTIIFKIMQSNIKIHAKSYKYGARLKY